MAELIVSKIDYIHSDFYLNTKTFKRGMVIIARDDNHPWTDTERNNPDWIILKFPGEPKEKFKSYEVQELPKDPINPSKTLQIRAFKIDLDSLVVDDKLSYAKLEATKVQVLEVKDPAVIGPTPDI